MQSFVSWQLTNGQQEGRVTLRVVHIIFLEVQGALGFLGGQGVGKGCDLPSYATTSRSPLRGPFDLKMITTQVRIALMTPSTTRIPSCSQDRGTTERKRTSVPLNQCSLGPGTNPSPHLALFGGPTFPFSSNQIPRASWLPCLP